MRYLAILLILASTAGAGTYYVTQAAAGGGAGTEGDPWTLEEACDNVAVGDTIYIKADANYVTQYDTGGAKNSIMYLKTAGTQASKIEWVGYKNTPGDGGVVIIDATDTYANAAETDGSAYDNNFWNISFRNGTGDAVAGTGFGRSTFWHCEFRGAGQDGSSNMTYPTFINCQFIDNARYGYAVPNIVTCFSCSFIDNGSWGFYEDTAGSGFHHLAYCTFTGNATGGALLDDESEWVFYACTFDGNGTAGSVAIRWDTQGFLDLPVPIINSIIYDWHDGLYCDNPGYAANYFNLFNSNNYDVNQVGPSPLTTGDGVGNMGIVSSAPAFADEANYDYTLTISSPALDAGIDANYCGEFWADFDNGINPPTISGGYRDLGASQRE